MNRESASSLLSLLTVCSGAGTDDPLAEVTESFPLNFDGDSAIKARITAMKDLTHHTLADGRQYFVRSQTSPNGNGHRCLNNSTSSSALNKCIVGFNLGNALPFGDPDKRRPATPIDGNPIG